MDELRQMAATLLMAIWRGIPSDYKSRYRRTLWEQFEAEIVSAAYTNHLGRFANSLCGRLDATLGRTQAERAACERILNSGRDRELLSLIRLETALIVLMVRVAMQERRAEFEALNEED
jgi:hypothetical protein